MTYTLPQTDSDDDFEADISIRHLSAAMSAAYGEGLEPEAFCRHAIIFAIGGLASAFGLNGAALQIRQMAVVQADLLNSFAETLDQSSPK